jgi:hypothetical protein
MGGEFSIKPKYGGVDFIQGASEGTFGHVNEIRDSIKVWKFLKS